MIVTRTFLGFCRGTSLKSSLYIFSGITVTSAPVSTLNVMETSRMSALTIHHCPSNVDTVPRNAFSDVVTSLRVAELLQTRE